MSSSNISRVAVWPPHSTCEAYESAVPANDRRNIDRKRCSECVRGLREIRDRHGQSGAVITDLHLKDVFSVQIDAS